jgi:flagellar biosynthesis regulator FlaF
MMKGLKNEISPEFLHFSKFFGVPVGEKYTFAYILENRNPVNTIPYLMETSGKTLGWLC